MNAKPTLTLAAVVSFTVSGASPVAAQRIAQRPAEYRGAATCATKYPGSFLDVGMGTCWQCPNGYARTAAPVTAVNACERGAYETFKRATGPTNPTGLLGTDCARGWFLDIGRRKCYSCAGYNRTGYPIDHARACSKLEPKASARATHKGPEGCPAGSFRHGLTAHCYACASGYVRNAAIADDLTKVNACTRIEPSQREATRAKFEQHKNDHPQTRANLARSAEVMKSESECADHRTDCATGGRSFLDNERRNQMIRTLSSELDRESGFTIVSWIINGGGSIGVGYMHGEGYAMTLGKNKTAFECRKVWSNSFTAGVALGGGAIEEITLSPGELIENDKSESNGWQVGIAAIGAAGYGLHWDAETKAMSVTWAWGLTPNVEINASEYVHTWAETGKVVDCLKMTWGDGWKDL